MNLQLLTGVLNGEGLENFASQLNASTEETKKGLDVALPNILDALNNTILTAEGAETLNQELDKNDFSSLGNLIDYLKNPNLAQGARILSKLLGENTENIIQTIAKMSGLNLGSSTKMLQMLVPLVIGTLGQVKKETNLDVKGMSSIISIVSTALKAEGGAAGLISMFSGALGGENKGNNMAEGLLDIAGGLFSKK